jgi:hypothetical protein
LVGQEDVAEGVVWEEALGRGLAGVLRFVPPGSWPWAVAVGHWQF